MRARALVLWVAASVLVWLLLGPAAAALPATYGLAWWRTRLSGPSTHSIRTMLFRSYESSTAATLYDAWEKVEDKREEHLW